MKRVKIIKKFKDLQRYDRIYPLGTVYEVEEERAEELISKGFVEEVIAKEEDIIFTIGGVEVGRIKAEAEDVAVSRSNVAVETPEAETDSDRTATVLPEVETPEDKKPIIEKAVPSKKPQPNKKK